MSTYEIKENSGSLFKNQGKTSDNHPDYTGKINIGGKLLELSGWARTSKDGTKKYMSLSVREPKDLNQTASTGTSVGEPDDLPF